jgi:hypothetical protein
MLEGILRHLDQTSVFGPSAVALVVILGVNFTLTLVHALQEFRGRLWRYFGAIVGVSIADAVGISLFFVGLTVLLWIVGWIGITGYVPAFGPCEQLAMGAIGAMVGGRLSDRRYSHVLLDRQGYKPNPGLQSTPFYAAEGVFLTVVFLPGLARHYVAGVLGFVLCWAFFFGVLPLIRLLRVFPSLRREAWRAGERAPAWTGLASEVPRRERAGVL